MLREMLRETDIGDISPVPSQMGARTYTGAQTYSDGCTYKGATDIRISGKKPGLALESVALIMNF